MGNDEPLVAAADDFGLLCMVVANGFTDAVLARLAEGGFDDAKFAHGFVVQGLLAGDRTVTELAERLGISAQAVSKTVQEMESMGYLERARDPEDGRAWTLAMTPRMRESIALSRQARLDTQQRLLSRLGPERSATVLAALRDIADEFGGLEALAGRRLRPN